MVNIILKIKKYYFNSCSISGNRVSYTEKTKNIRRKLSVCNGTRTHNHVVRKRILKICKGIKKGIASTLIDWLIEFSFIYVSHFRDGNCLENIINSIAELI